MKRDMDLIREILLAAEAIPAGEGTEIEIEGKSEAEVMQHVKLLVGRGYLEASGTEDSSGVAYTVFGLTWEGHDFLDDARTPGLWAEIKEEINAKGLASASMGIIKDLMEAALKRRLGLS